LESERSKKVNKQLREQLSFLGFYPVCRCPHCKKESDEDLLPSEGYYNTSCEHCGLDFKIYPIIVCKTSK
jgi:hypothetical protein